MVGTEPMSQHFSPCLPAQDERYKPLPFCDQLGDYIFHSREHIANGSRPKNGHEQTVCRVGLSVVIAVDAGE